MARIVYGDFQTFESVSNEAPRHDDNDNEDFHIPRPDELAYFIKYANGVKDPDFRRSGICPWEPVPPMKLEIREYAYPEHQIVRKQPPPDIAEAREQLKESLEDSLLEEVFILGHVDNDLRGEGRFSIWPRLACRTQCMVWHLYCRRFEDDPDPSHKGWTWRILILSADFFSPILYGRTPTFDSIPEFLDRYSSWYDHLDLRQLRRHIAEDGGESEPEV